MNREERKQFQQLYDELNAILVLPNMGNEGRKAKLTAIFAWKIKFDHFLSMKGEKKP